MSEPTQPDAEAPAPEPASTPAPESAAPPPASDAPITAREAADLISGKTDTPSAPDGADAAPKEARGEADDSEPEQPSLTPPRSWTKEDKQAFSLLPRDAQERILVRDRQRELDVSRSLNEAAAQRQAAEAMAQQAEQAQYQAQQQYEQSLPEKTLLAEAEYRKEFGTPTQDEVNEWAQFDQTKWVRWKNAVEHVTAARAELYQVQERQYQQQQQAWQTYYQQAEAWKGEEAKKLVEKVPEWGDPKTYPAKVAKTLEFMESVGFPREEVQRYATEYASIPIHDHRLQLIVDKAMRYDEAMAATKQPARAPVPPVQRPGSAPARGEANEERFKNLTRQLDRTGSLRDGAALIAARMNGRS